MSFNKNIVVLAGTLFLSTSVFASSNADKAISAAEAAQKAAAQVGYEWRDTGKMIKQAKDLAQQGKTDEAVRVAKMAEEQGKKALSQYHAENKRYGQ